MLPVSICEHSIVIQRVLECMIVSASLQQIPCHFTETENDYYDDSLLQGTVVIKSDTDPLPVTALNQVAIFSC